MGEPAAVIKDAYRYICRRGPSPVYMVGTKTCELRRKRAEKSDAIELERCRDCPGPEKLAEPRHVEIAPTYLTRPALPMRSEVQAKETNKGDAGKVPVLKPVERKEPELSEPRCKRHSDRPAVIFESNGRSSGKCRECMSENMRRANKVMHGNKEDRKKQAEEALERNGRNKEKTALDMGVSLSTLNRHLGPRTARESKKAAPVPAQADDGTLLQRVRALLCRPILEQLERAAARVECLLVLKNNELGAYGDLVLATKELTTTLRLAGLVGAIPGWPGKDEGAAGK